MALSLEKFAARLAESGIALESEIVAVRTRFNPGDAETFARLLVKQKLLTAYQAQQIYAGKGKSLILGNYLILDQIGQGGMGTVLKATHRRMNRVVALKVLSSKVVGSSSLLSRFHREAQAAARLDHPNIVAAFDADEFNGTHFFVMQFVDGSDLASVVKQRGPLAIEQAVSCTIQAARGLEYAHRNGVIHRDIKPANLLLDLNGTVKILDMGLARIEGQGGDNADLTSTGVVMGTVDYMAPEQAMNTRTADARSDIYSLGATLWYLLAGRPLYGGESVMSRLMAHANTAIPSLHTARTDCTVPLDAVFRKMVAKAPADRFQSMTEVVTALEACLRPETATAGDEMSGTGSGAVSKVEGAAEVLALPSENSKLNEFLGIFDDQSVPQGSGVVGKRKSDASPFDVTVSNGQGDARTDPETLTALRNKALGLSSIRSNQPPWWKDRSFHVGAAIAAVAGVILAIFILSSRGRAASGSQEPQPQPLRETPAVPSAKVTTPPERFAFGLAGGHITSPLQIDLSGPLTLEAWITPSREFEEQQTSLYGINQINLRGGREWSMVIWTDGPEIALRSGVAPVADRRTHVAGVYTPAEARLYVDGKLEARRDLTDVKPVQTTVPFETGWELTDTLDDVRVSKSARYDGDFKPPSVFTADTSTVLLYNLNEGAGDRALDSSGNARHGAIFRAKWVRVPVPPDEIPAAGPTQGADRERAATEWVLSAGGNVIVNFGSVTQKIGDRASIPAVTYVVNVVDLSGTRVRDADLARIADLPEVDWLNLLQTHVGDAGMRHVSKMTSLTRLWLLGTDVTDAGLREIRKLDRLKFLGLNGTKVSDAGIADLSAMTSLTGIDLRNTRVTPSGVVRLRTALPACRIQSAP